MSARYWFSNVVVGVIWGTSFLFIAVLLRELSPFWIAAGRLAIGALASWAFLVALRNPFQPTPCSI